MTRRVCKMPCQSLVRYLGVLMDGEMKRDSQRGEGTKGMTAKISEDSIRA